MIEKVFIGDDSLLISKSFAVDESLVVAFLFARESKEMTGSWLSLLVGVEVDQELWIDCE